MRKMMEFDEVAKLNPLIREKTISMFIADWKILMDFLHKAGENKFMSFTEFCCNYRVIELNLQLYL